jgi:hypothetical protein
MLVFKHLQVFLRLVPAETLNQPLLLLEQSDRMLHFVHLLDFLREGLLEQTQIHVQLLLLHLGLLKATALLLRLSHEHCHHALRHRSLEVEVRRGKSQVLEVVLLRNPAPTLHLQSQFLIFLLPGVV